MMPAEAMALFDALDSDGDGALSPDEFGKHAWEVSVRSPAPPIPTASPTSSLPPVATIATATVITTTTFSNRPHHSTYQASVGKHMSYSSPESDWGGPRADELFQSLDKNHDNVLDRSEVRRSVLRTPAPSTNENDKRQTTH